MPAVCNICPHACELSEGQTGQCRARINRKASIESLTYGQISSCALDPIEKKPLRRFHPGASIFSIGSYGCNLRCPFCQNASIAAVSPPPQATRSFSPEELVELALSLRDQGNIGIAYTYNEPLINYEFIFDCARAAAECGLVNVIVSNGYVNKDPLKKLLPYLDAANIDLKGFTDRFYRKLGGTLGPVKESITILADAPNCHLEVTTLVIPDENDTEKEIEACALWLASISPDIPYHISRFFPCHRMSDREPTPISTVYRLAEVARAHLKNVYTGNC